MQKKDSLILKFILFVLVIILLSLLLWTPFKSFLSSQQSLEDFVLKFGILAPIIFIFIVILQVLFAPIPGQLTGLASGYIFGALFGTIYSMVGLIIGSWIAFTLSRRYGRPFVEKVVKKETLKKFDKILLKNGLFTLFLIYLLPIFPDDAICYVAGLSKIKIKDLVIISAIGRLPGFIILNLVGAKLISQNSNLSFIILGALMIISFIAYLNKNRLENSMIRVIKRFKK